MSKQKMPSEELSFELRVLRQHWIRDDGEYDPYDLCSHGVIYLRIGNELLSDATSDSWCLSVASLYLLRTLRSDYTIEDFGNYLVPCCGHMMWIDESTDLIQTAGCNLGIDWHVKHEPDFVRLTTENGITSKVSKAAYKQQIMTFAEEVEVFYGNPAKKKVHGDNYDIDMLHHFWKEWRLLKSLVT